MEKIRAKNGGIFGNFFFVTFSSLSSQFSV